MEVALAPDVYAHLRALAGRIHAGHAGSGPNAPPIQPTELLHEAWLKLAGSDSTFSNRGHFFAVAARAMRQILVDQARARMTDKRGAGARRTTVAGLGADDRGFDLLALDASLDRLAEVDPVTAEIVVLRTFGGLTVDEAAVIVGASARTVARKWRFGRAFLEQALGDATD